MYYYPMGVDKHINSNTFLGFCSKLEDQDRRRRYKHHAKSLVRGIEPSPSKYGM